MLLSFSKVSPPPSAYYGLSPIQTPQVPVTLPIPAQQPLYVQGMKRGSDELLGHSQLPMVTNGASPLTVMDANNDAKKVKLDQSQVGPPSKVVHIRSIPTDASEAEVVALGLPFGKVTNVLVMKKKNQAFLEFGDENQASTMVSYHTEVPANIRGRTAYVQFSTHKELKTEVVNPAAQAALQAADSVQGEGQKTVLRVIVENMIYPVTIEVLYQIFTKFGTVLKIITFTKNNSFQALIQMADPVAAQAGKLSLDGQNIYTGCNSLRIDFSKLSSLNVKYNNEKSRDYTNPSLPTGDSIAHHHPMDHGAAAFALGTPSVLASPFATAVPGFGATQLTAYGAAHPAGAAQMRGLPAGGAGGGSPLAGFPGMQPSPGATSMGLAGLQLGGMTTGPVVLVSNLSEEMVTPDALFTLFGVYGDVHRVKILFNKKDNALIQFAEPKQAALAIQYLDKVKVWDKQIRVAPSKHPVVQMPKDGQTDGGQLTKDYTNSPLHRFKKKGSKNYQNIYPPSATLHLSNIPPTATEEELKEAFGKHGVVKNFKFFPKDRKMALIEMSQVEEAVLGLMGMHNYQLSDSSHLRVSFSKSTI
ncbi:polypyrimidine tract-binding protein 1 isoform X2 [Lingula anatina]|uniref:Polypyrimidine tract-binding protein 1 isoform X2 n=1 Tax=Lingula anatina TaxID=7574 RepID=A0A1S3J968_LINAN|nr:polypyrimidine tract-binding protein 1 isoform X2 [Lingula anatina]|eukprot:XP_013406945.1 polypyrimidine tract-binding protein 1 isoform X2 [Lingula anatina]